MVYIFFGEKCLSYVCSEKFEALQRELEETKAQAAAREQLIDSLLQQKEEDEEKELASIAEKDVSMIVLLCNNDWHYYPLCTGPAPEEPRAENAHRSSARYRARAG